MSQEVLFEWEDKYDLGISKVNDEHRKLIDLMNQLHKEVSEDADRRIQTRTLRQLADYSRFHFDEEEAYMASIEFEGLERHKYLHQQLLGRLDEFVEQFNSGASELDSKFFSFLKLWLSAHIMGIDKKYSEQAAA